MSETDVVIVHELPGRLRLRLRRPPRSIERLLTDVEKHEGIESTSFNRVSRSLLVTFNPVIVTATEIVTRAAVSLSLDYAQAGITISYDARGSSLKPIDYYAGLSLGAATAAKAVGTAQATRIMEYNAGAATMLSVFNHAWMEVTDEGVYHPEVISVMYLINSMLKGNFLTASAVTWLATFGRHLVDSSSESCRLQAAEVEGNDGEGYIDVMVQPLAASQVNPLKLLVTALGNMIGIEQPAGRNRIVGRIAQMSAAHGDVLEGMGRQSNRVYMRLNR